ncbi:MAG: hypothetical protein F6K40_26420 [Okeania sp. SIO3I5]|uniref:hypothetical protein n=1 Tax=Okeania sp. SIO3I5 TaxID=2607805 RepID=UPI0013BD1A5B|nr:hypothetical protein [Okeania sp. SIO3I5]NEQ39599.1 hypothetical protein [Okeania sp. SIO3I5]
MATIRSYCRLTLPTLPLDLIFLLQTVSKRYKVINIEKIIPIYHLSTKLFNHQKIQFLIPDQTLNNWKYNKLLFTDGEI